MKGFLTKKISRDALEALLREHRSGEYTLDLGCGLGMYRELFPNRVGFDIAPGPAVDVVGDAHALPFPDGTFDRILCTEVLEHLHTPHTAIAEMQRVLKPGGTLILTTPFVFPLHDAPHDYYRYTKYGLKHLFRDWDIIELRPNLSSQKSLAVLLQRVGYQTTLRANALGKFLVFVAARILNALPSLMVEEYGDIKRSAKEKDIFAGGHFLVAKKK
jgi:SAM-dependent methyltransferase